MVGFLAKTASASRYSPGTSPSTSTSTCTSGCFCYWSRRTTLMFALLLLFPTNPTKASQSSRSIRRSLHKRLFGTTRSIDMNRDNNHDHNINMQIDGVNYEDDDNNTTMIGGGAINEKQRTNTTQLPRQQQQNSNYDPIHVRSHLFHSIEGLHRYPNYLSRWTSSHAQADMDQLELALRQELDRVRQQRSALNERQLGIDRLVQQLLLSDQSARWKKLLQQPQTWDDVKERILDPAASRAIFGSRQWKKNAAAPSVADVLSGQTNVELDVGKLTELMDEELPDVFSFSLLTRDFCRELCAYVRALAQLEEEQEEGEDSGAIVGLGRRPVNLDTIGLSWINDLVFGLVMRPLSRHLFAGTETGGADLDWRNGFVAGYSARPAPETATPRERLVSHTDDSEVTLNVCLGEDSFEGGLLDFRGLRGTDEQGDLLGTYQPVIGKAVIHAGRHFHDVTQLTKGNRFALILWARSWQGVRSSTCPCCWLNRRRESSSGGGSGGPCICGAQWN